MLSVAGISPPPVLANGYLRPNLQTRTQTLLLDSQIRDWVVLPLLVLMVAAGLLRSHVGRLLRPAPKPVGKVEARTKSALARSSRLRSGAGGFLSGTRWEARRIAWSARDGAYGLNSDGWLRLEAVRADKDKETLQQTQQLHSENSEDGTNPPMPGLPGMDPTTMMDGMKGNVAAMVQNMVMMQGISHFFRGFVLVRVPFHLTRGFKQMFQRGLFDLTTLDTSYVSSVSWYFLVMFGLRAFFRLALGDPLQEEIEGNEIQRGLGREYGSGPPGNQFDGSKALRMEADNLELLTVRSRRSNIDEAERKLLGKRYPKKINTSGKNRNDEDAIFGFNSVGRKAKAPGLSNKKKSS